MEGRDKFKRGQDTVPTEPQPTPGKRAYTVYWSLYQSEALHLQGV
jgi:hypothetical protein